MLNYLKLIAGIFLMAMLTSFVHIDSNNCSILKEGTFKYGGIDEEILVKIDGENHTEFHEGGKYIIKSKLVWVNDCEYNMTMTEITIPNFPYGVGDVMNVKVNKVSGNKIFYTSTVKNQRWEGTLLKLKSEK